jgi:hypothetical protein
MSAEMDRCEHRVDLTKQLATYYVVADDEGVYCDPVWKDDESIERYILEVQRASDHPVERGVQWEDLSAACDDSQSPLILRRIEAVSHGHAAYLLRQEFATAWTFVELTDVFYADELAFHGAGFSDSAS